MVIDAFGIALVDELQDAQYTTSQLSQEMIQRNSSNSPSGKP
jgi:hypothetical protein